MTFSDSIGPVYTKSQAFDHLQLTSPGEVGWLTANKCLLSLRTVDDAEMWPAFQFHAGLIRPSVGPLLWTFASIDPDPWSLAVWMNRPNEGLDGDTPAESLNPEAVLTAANRVIARWRA